MPDSTEKPVAVASAPKKSKSKTTKTPGKTAIVRTESGKFEKGHSANPGGKPKQIFHTAKPFKQALMRALKERSDTGNIDELQRVADRLVEQAMTGMYPLGAITEIANRLDGSPEKEAAAPQQNTLQLVMNSIRVLNLSPEQRNEFVKQLTSQQRLDADGHGGEPSGGA